MASHFFARNTTRKSNLDGTFKQIPGKKLQPEQMSKKFLKELKKVWNKNFRKRFFFGKKSRLGKFLGIIVKTFPSDFQFFCHQFFTIY